LFLGRAPARRRIVLPSRLELPFDPLSAYAGCGIHIFRRTERPQQETHERAIALAHGFFAKTPAPPAR
jgi:hypothetical protein